MGINGDKSQVGCFVDLFRAADLWIINHLIVKGQKMQPHGRFIVLSRDGHDGPIVHHRSSARRVETFPSPEAYEEIVWWFNKA